MFLLFFRNVDHSHYFDLSYDSIVGSFSTFDDAKREAKKMFLLNHFYVNNTYSPYDFSFIYDVNNNLKNIPLSYSKEFFIVDTTKSIPCDLSFSLKNKSSTGHYFLSKEDINEVFLEATLLLHKAHNITPLKKSEANALFEAIWNDPINGYDKFYSN